ncbi:CD209g antigen [Apodemus speciosus]|uniref:CD209g antigen n=1 Tax=Apodemus speciosus TaxID=105296 RepID=A0ABQ0F1L4_APOSI
MNTSGHNLLLGAQLYPSVGPAGHLTRIPWLLLLLISLGLFLLMLAILIQVSRIRVYAQGRTQDQQGNSSLERVAVPQEQTHVGLEQIQQIQQQLTQFNASLAGLCRPCPWDWELFQGSCYLFSRTLGSWETSASSCKDLGAHLVIVNSVAEQLLERGEPNNAGDEDCVVIVEDKWNDSTCH